MPVRDRTPPVQPIIPPRPVVRGCGLRIAGAIYWEFSPVRAMPDGNNSQLYNGPYQPRILLDPPVAIDPEALGMTAVGVHAFERDGVTHLLDWIGEDHYPNVADFIEECRRWGVSRRIPRNIPWRNITPQSQLLLVHRRGIISNWREYRPVDPWGNGFPCPGVIAEHRVANTDEFCSGIWWEDVQGGVRPSNTPLGDRTVVREMPWGVYTARHRPAAVSPQYETAIVARVPLGNIAVIRDQDGRHNEVYSGLSSRLRPNDIYPNVMDY